MSSEIILTFAVLGVTIFLFVSEWLSVDVVALCVMFIIASAIASAIAARIFAKLAGETAAGDTI